MLGGDYRTEIIVENNDTGLGQVLHIEKNVHLVFFLKWPGSAARICRGVVTMQKHKKTMKAVSMNTWFHRIAEW